LVQPGSANQSAAAFGISLPVGCLDFGYKRKTGPRSSCQPSEEQREPSEEQREPSEEQREPSEEQGEPSEEQREPSEEQGEPSEEQREPSEEQGFKTTSLTTFKGNFIIIYHGEELYTSIAQRSSN